ncbi:MAG: hypothetical protein JSS81_00015 [Acidobacteria bacterium]|nr:hypothetical protein [Acidobacteriota bacterium]
MNNNDINAGNNCVAKLTCADFNAPIALTTDRRAAARVGQIGNVRTARTGAFGFYRFDNLTAGETVVVPGITKRFRFDPQFVNVADNIADLTFVASSE